MQTYIRKYYSKKEKYVRLINFSKIIFSYLRICEASIYLFWINWIQLNLFFINIQFSYSPAKKMASQFASKCQKLIKSSISLFNSYRPDQPLGPQLINSPILQDIKIPFQFHKEIGKNIGILNIFTHPSLRISIFHLPHGTTMKLHDHPDMHVITCILQGSMQAKVFTRHERKSGLFVKQTKLLHKGEIALTQPINKNYHQFTGLNQKCSFIDVLFPDYNETDRICSYYNAQASQIVQSQQTYKLIKLAHDYHDDMCEI